MKAVIRADASLEIGTGHIMRCLTLADGLRKKGADVTFVCREHMGNLCDFIEEKNFKVCHLPLSTEQLSKLNWNQHATWLGVTWEQDSNETIDALQNFDSKPDLLIIDHYALGSRWEKRLRSFVKKIMVIDDLADRSHDCDFILDQNLFQNFENRYENLVPQSCQNFLGPSYALLRPEFKKKRKTIKARDGLIKNIFVFMGGTDPTNETQKVLNTLKNISNKDISISVVLGSSNQYQENTKLKFREMKNMLFYSDVNNMAGLMSEADLAIGGGGVTSWERCSVMLPSIIISLAENQIEIAENLEKAGAAIYLGKSKNVSSDELEKTILKLFFSPNNLIQMSRNASSLVDGKGTSRVIKGLGIT